MNNNKVCLDCQYSMMCIGRWQDLPADWEKKYEGMCKEECDHANWVIFFKCHECSKSIAQMFDNYAPHPSGDGDITVKEYVIPDACPRIDPKELRECYVCDRLNLLDSRDADWEDNYGGLS